MGVQSLEEDLQFVHEFHGYLVQLIDAVKSWETTDARAVERGRERHERAYYEKEEAERIEGFRQVYGRLRTTINLGAVRLRNIAARYQLGFNEGWIYRMPASEQTNPNEYMFSFGPQAESAIIRDIQLIRGAIDNDLRIARRLAARPWRRRVYEDRVLPTARWFISPEHSKFTLVAGLATIVAVVLRLLGFDGKTIIDIIKAIKGQD
ncbi:MAG: hypothetical protein ABSC23_12560 [Bryobacteraceae bacterium]|jgi:hypothetical protein